MDMLGRQQIAGIQNAMSELFKNAYDAYARNVCIDYFEDDELVVIRDDGIGMTPDDFESKWLVVGTESKVGAEAMKQYRPPDLDPRPITGEKGIGRLAIALLGRQVLVLSRAVRDDGLHDLVVALVHWGLFEKPGLNLEDIEVPVETVRGGELPDADCIANVKARLTASVEALSKVHPELDFSQILKDVAAFTPDLADLASFFERADDSLRLTGSGTGTHFLIWPGNPILKLEILAEERNQDYSFRKQLLGFCNEVFLESTPAPLHTSFRRWQPGALAGDELLGADTFFSQRELQDRADHLLVGDVDEFGQFKGSLRVYDQHYDDVIVPWSEGGGKPTTCGPFKVIFGYLMGRQAESRLPPEEYSQLNSKLDLLGGMYVYVNRIRVLPYGDHSFDWLEVEKRRNKGAGYYFFSFRRMLGAVLLTRERNGTLEEKAGREGFQQNAAYRHLRDILMNLFVQLAAEFFRKGGTNTELFEKAQTDIRRRGEALERQQKRATAKRVKFARGLETFFGEVNSGLPEAEVGTLRQLTHSRMEAASKLADKDKAAAALIRAEKDAVARLLEVRQKYDRKKPAGIALTRDLGRSWDAYQLEKSRLDRDVFRPFEDDIAQTLGAVATQARLYIDQRKRLEDRIRALATERHRDLDEAVKQARDTASETRNTVFEITQKALSSLDGTIKTIEADLNRTNLDLMEPDQIEDMRKGWETQLNEIEGRHRDALTAARDMLASLAENLRSSDGEEPAQIMEAMEERMLALEEQADDDFEMVQLGLAVAIINHEFAAAIKNVRRSVQELGQISRRSDALRPLYQAIRSNFEHLDGHLNLFTPLQRRLYRSTQAISGKSIKNYITDLFSNRFERHKIALDCTPAFLSTEIDCYPSTLYPVFINLVDNAIFWLANVEAAPRTVRLDAEAGRLIIANNGPAIEERDREKVFERGFSRRPGGRGLGLFIARKALQTEAMNLELAAAPVGFGVAFHIAAPTLKFVS